MQTPPAAVFRACLFMAAGLLAACQPAVEPPAASAASSAAAAQVGGASASAPTPSPVLATLNGAPIERAQFDQLLKIHAGTHNPYDLPSASASTPTSAEPVDRRQLFDELLDIELLAQKAHQLGIDKQPAIVAETELLTKSVLAKEFMRQTIAGISVSRDELQALYEEQVPVNEFQVRQQALPSRAAADARIERLRRGKPMSSEPTWAMASELPPEVLAAIRSLKPGEFSPQPVAVGPEWHVIQLVALRPAPARPTLETATAWLHPQIVRSKVQALQQAWLQQAHIQKSPTP